MKTTFVLLLVLIGYRSAYSQDYLVKEIESLKHTNDSLQEQVVKSLQDSILNLKTTNVALLAKMQSQVDSLEKSKANLNNKIERLQTKLDGLNKSNVIIERDTLRNQVKRLTANTAFLMQNNQEKDRQLSKEKQQGDDNAKVEKEKGKQEILENISSGYINKNFDTLIKISTKLSVQRDLQLVGNTEKVKTILSDLEKYFNAEELFTKKIDAEEIKNKLMQLNQIKQPSTMLGKLKEKIKYYKDCNDELKKTIQKIIKIDDNNTVGGNKDIQKRKFNQIIGELADYIYNNYNYIDYKYLSDIVIEIIKRKGNNADAPITDLSSDL